LVASAEQEAELRALSRSDVRGEADRARAILLTLQGWTGVQLAEAFGVTPDAVRHWRGWFSERGVDALRSSLAPGPSPARGERALAVASRLLRQPVEGRTNWTLPRLRAEVERRRSPVIERQAGASISAGRLSVLLKRGASRGAGPGTF
jgi:transposase